MARSRLEGPGRLRAGLAQAEQVELEGEGLMLWCPWREQERVQAREQEQERVQERVQEREQERVRAQVPVQVPVQAQVPEQVQELARPDAPMLRLTLACFRVY